jgi:hypothetical protein
VLPVPNSLLLIRFNPEHTICYPLRPIILTFGFSCEWITGDPAHHLPSLQLIDPAPT